MDFLVHNHRLRGEKLTVDNTADSFNDIDVSSE